MFKIFAAAFLTVFLYSGNTIYDFHIPAANGSIINFSNYQGKKILIVNTALNSKYTYQLQALQQLYNLYKDSLVVIAVPSDSFENEPNDDSTIAGIMASMFNVSFTVAAKIEVSGPDTDSLYLWLTQKNQNGALDNVIHGDFTKYLINESGQLIGMFQPSVEPLDEELQNAIKDIE
jgi:glutathione peroxidase